LFEATLFLLASQAGLATLSFDTVLRWVERLGGGRGADGPGSGEAPDLPPALQRRLDAVDVVGRYLFPDGPCLPQALVAHVLLRRAPLPAHLRIGTRLNAAGSVEAHAWVENGGRVVMGDLADLDSYTPLAPGRFEG
jgi:hypothetical protein